MVGDGARGEEGGVEGVGGCGGAVPGVGDPALDGGALVLHPPAQIEGGLGVRHGGVVCLSGVGIRDGMGGAAGWSSKWILILFFLLLLLFLTDFRVGRVWLGRRKIFMETFRSFDH